MAEKNPMDVDLDELYEVLDNSVFNNYDHRYLNEVLGTDRVTSELLAFRIYKDLVDAGFDVVKVEVCETRDLCVEFTATK